MNSNAQTLAIGLEFHLAGQLQRAERVYRQVMQIDPTCADAHHLLGLVCLHNGQLDQARALIQQALDIDDTSAVYHSSLASVYRKLQQLPQAVLAYRRALSLNPDDSGDHFDLGLAYLHLGQFDEALASFGRAISLQPDFAEAHHNAGIVLGLLNRHAEAVTCFEHAVRHRPDYTEAHHNLAVALEKQNNFTQAETSLRRAIEADPDIADIHFSLGRVLEKQDKITESAASYRRAVALRPDRALWQLKIDGLCPAVMPGVDAILSWRNRFEAALDRYPPGSINLKDWLDDIPIVNVYPPFNLPYHGLDDLHLKQKYARIFTVRPAEPMPEPAKNGPYRIGFLVTTGHEGIFLSLVKGLINRLQHPLLQPVIICGRGRKARIAAGISNPRVLYLELPENLGQAVQKIRAGSFDFIYYWEAGSDALNYFLPFFRLAPVQVATWGLSVTTGIPHMDYFISSELLETAQAAAHYSERLVNFKTLPTYFYRPTVPQPLAQRQKFGLANTDHVYLCVQNLLKFHPDFDSIVGQILRRDPSGKLVLIRDGIENRNTALLNRLRITQPEVVGRVQFVAKQKFSDYVSLLAVSDVMLDTIHYGGGNTAHEALAVGTPVVTLPGQFLRSRLTLGRYKKMGVMDCVAGSPQQYVELAVQLGTDPFYRAKIKAKILAASPLLYNDNQAVTEFEQFCLTAIEAASVKST